MSLRERDSYLYCAINRTGIAANKQYLRIPTNSNDSLKEFKSTFLKVRFAKRTLQNRRHLKPTNSVLLLYTSACLITFSFECGLVQSISSHLIFNIHILVSFDP